jgi:hypothetical protein
MSNERAQATRELPAVTCDDCFFRRAELCALPGNVVCPTFRSDDAVAPKPERAAPPPRLPFAAAAVA